jgi:SNF2 family DNA or RNA helicase
LDLPDKLPDEVIKVDLKEKALYKKLATTSALLEYEILAENPLSRMIKLRQLCAGHLKTEDGLIETKTEKLEILKEIIEGYEEDKKLVIFAEFKYSISKIAELLKVLKIKFVVLDGDQKDKTIWRKFQEDKKIRIIVCQYQTANAGIDLFASDTILYYEPCTRSTILEQSRDRIHRGGQTNKCSYIHLLTRGTIEVDIYKALASYSDFNERLFLEYMNTYRKSYNS